MTNKQKSSDLNELNMASSQKSAVVQSKNTAVGDELTGGDLINYKLLAQLKNLAKQTQEALLKSDNGEQLRKDNARFAPLHATRTLVNATKDRSAEKSSDASSKGANKKRSGASEILRILTTNPDVLSEQERKDFDLKYSTIITNLYDGYRLFVTLPESEKLISTNCNKYAGRNIRKMLERVIRSYVMRVDELIKTNPNYTIKPIELIGDSVHGFFTKDSADGLLNLNAPVTHELQILLHFSDSETIRNAIKYASTLAKDKPSKTKKAAGGDSSESKATTTSTTTKTQEQKDADRKKRQEKFIFEIGSEYGLASYITTMRKNITAEIVGDTKGSRLGMFKFSPAVTCFLSMLVHRFISYFVADAYSANYLEHRHFSAEMINGHLAGVYHKYGKMSMPAAVNHVQNLVREIEASVAEATKNREAKKVVTSKTLEERKAASDRRRDGLSKYRTRVNAEKASKRDILIERTAGIASMISALEQDSEKKAQVQKIAVEQSVSTSTAANILASKRRG